MEDFNTGPSLEEMEKTKTNTTQQRKRKAKSAPANVSTPEDAKIDESTSST